MIVSAGLATTRYRASLNAFPARNLGKESASIACSVIDFASQCCRIASLVFHSVGSAITNNVSVLRTQQKQREITFKYT